MPRLARFSHTHAHLNLIASFYIFACHSMEVIFVQGDLRNSAIPRFAQAQSIVPSQDSRLHENLSPSVVRPRPSAELNFLS